MTVLFAGDDWAAGHHDVELMDQGGRTLERARLSEGAAGMAKLRALIGEHAGVADGEDDLEVRIGIETDHGPWVTALAAAGYVVFAVNPLQAARYRERHVVPGARSDTGDGRILADMVRTDAHRLRPVADDTDEAQAVKIVARAHKTLIWERNRQAARLRYQLRDFFPGRAGRLWWPGPGSADVLELLGKAPDPAAAAKLTTAPAVAALKRAHRRHVAGKTTMIRAALRAPQLTQPAQVTGACAAVVRALAAVIVTLNQQITALQGQVEAYFPAHPDAEIVLSQPGLGQIPGARVPGEFGDDPARYASARARKNYAATSPITRQSGNRKTVMARYVHNDRLRDPRTPGLLSPDRIAGSTRLLRPAPRPRDRARPRATPARQPPRRHPARLPQNPDPLRRGNRLAPKRQAISPSGLTSLTPGMPPKAEPAAGARPADPHVRWCERGRGDPAPYSIIDT